MCKPQDKGPALSEPMSRIKKQIDISLIVIRIVRRGTKATVQVTQSLTQYYARLTMPLMPARQRKTTANNTSKLRQFHCLCSRIDRQGRLQGFDNNFVVITGTFGWPLHHVPPASIYVLYVDLH